MTLHGVGFGNSLGYSLVNQVGIPIVMVMAMRRKWNKQGMDSQRAHDASNLRLKRSCHRRAGVAPGSATAFAAARGRVAHPCISDGVAQTVAGAMPRAAATDDARPPDEAEGGAAVSSGWPSTAASNVVVCRVGVVSRVEVVRQSTSHVSPTSVAFPCSLGIAWSPVDVVILRGRAIG